MATFEGFTLLSNFTGIFTFLFIFSVSLGVLSTTKIFGEKGKQLNPLIALTLAFFSLLTPGFSQAIAVMAPVLVVIVVGVFFIMLILLFLGVQPDQFKTFFSAEGPRENKAVIFAVLWLVLIVVSIVVSLQVGDEVGPYIGGNDDDDETTQNTTADNTLQGDSDQGNIQGESASSGSLSDDFASNLGATLFHPKVLGGFLILLFASIAVRQISTDE